MMWIFDKLIKALRNPILGLKFMSWEIRSLFYKQYIDEGGGKIAIRGSGMKLKIIKGKNAKFNLYGTLTLTPFFNDGAKITITIGDNAIFSINGDFMMGEGIQIKISSNAVLSLGGKDVESASGITGRSLIMVEERIVIGKDFLCAWDVFITDSDWHSIPGHPHQKDIKIGDHVWIANNNNILKGTILGDNCIVSSCSKVGNKVFENNQLIGGIPAKVLKENISWKRDLN